MNRKSIAQETLDIMENGYYVVNGEKIDISEKHRKSVEKSVLIRPEEDDNILKSCEKLIKVLNISTVKAVFNFYDEGINELALLNFASAKNPGGGFINGAMAQEESIAASSGLFETLTANREYYEVNRHCYTMMYTNNAIYSPKVIFFRDEKFNLVKTPVVADVLTLPAVNYGQVLLKGEDSNLAKKIMEERMKIALAIFAYNKNRNLILGAYGCGVFKNNPEDVALWWKKHLDNGYKYLFDNIIFAVLDNSKNQKCIKPFLEIFDCK